MIVINQICVTLFVRTMAELKKIYFLNFLPKQGSFKSEIAKRYCYIIIKKALEEPLTEPYLSFCAFTAHDFLSSFTFANRRAYDPSVVSFCVQILNGIQSKFIKKKNDPLTWSPIFTLT